MVVVATGMDRRAILRMDLDIKSGLIPKPLDRIHVLLACPKSEQMMGAQCPETRNGLLE